jgi:hypothetical protein
MAIYDDKLTGLSSPDGPYTGRALVTRGGAAGLIYYPPCVQYHGAPESARPLEAGG